MATNKQDPSVSNMSSIFRNVSENYAQAGMRLNWLKEGSTVDLLPLNTSGK